VAFGVAICLGGTIWLVVNRSWRRAMFSCLPVSVAHPPNWWWTPQSHSTTAGMAYLYARLKPRTWLMAHPE
jgi:hypothetical protein